MCLLLAIVALVEAGKHPKAIKIRKGKDHRLLRTLQGANFENVDTFLLMIWRNQSFHYMKNKTTERSNLKTK